MRKSLLKSVTQSAPSCRAGLVHYRFEIGNEVDVSLTKIVYDHFQNFWSPDRLPICMQKELSTLVMSLSKFESKRRLFYRNIDTKLRNQFIYFFKLSRSMLFSNGTNSFYLLQYLYHKNMFEVSNKFKATTRIRVKRKLYMVRSHCNGLDQVKLAILRLKSIL